MIKGNGESQIVKNIWDLRFPLVFSLYFSFIFILNSHAGTTTDTKPNEKAQQGKQVRSTECSDAPSRANTKSSATSGSGNWCGTQKPPLRSKELSYSQAMELRRNFQNSRQSRSKAMQHEQKISFQELERRQELRKQDWKREQTIRRDQFYSQVKEPIARRNFEREEERRWKEFLSELKSEQKQSMEHFSKRSQRMDLKDREKAGELEKYIKEGKLPPASFW